MQWWHVISILMLLGRKELSGALQDTDGLGYLSETLQYIEPIGKACCSIDHIAADLLRDYFDQQAPVYGSSSAINVCHRLSSAGFRSAETVAGSHCASLKTRATALLQCSFRCTKIPQNDKSHSILFGKHALVC